MTIVPDDPAGRLRINGYLEVSPVTRHATFYPYQRDSPVIDLVMATPGAQLAVDTWLEGGRIALPGDGSEEGEAA